MSLVLPAATESIKAPQYDGATFRDFTALKEVSGANIAAIGEFAFGNCRTLTSVSFPKVTSISQQAFSFCTSLTTASFPELTSIPNYAFNDCTSLTTASFPKAVSIGYAAFSYCSALTTASFPAVTSIGGDAFSYCSALTTASFPSVTSIGVTPFQNTGSAALTIELPKAAPSMPGYSISSDTYSKTVTIRTPPDRTGYNSSWQSSFKSKTFGNNVTITLIFEEVD